MRFKLARVLSYRESTVAPHSGRVHGVLSGITDVSNDNSSLLFSSEC